MTCRCILHGQELILKKLCHGRWYNAVTSDKWYNKLACIMSTTNLSPWHTHIYSVFRMYCLENYQYMSFAKLSIHDIYCIIYILQNCCWNVILFDSISKDYMNGHDLQMIPQFHKQGQWVMSMHYVWGLCMSQKFVFHMKATGYSLYIVANDAVI